MGFASDKIFCLLPFSLVCCPLPSEHFKAIIRSSTGNVLQAASQTHHARRLVQYEAFGQAKQTVNTL